MDVLRIVILNTMLKTPKCPKTSEIVAAAPRSKNDRRGSSEGHAAPILRGVRGRAATAPRPQCDGDGDDDDDDSVSEER